MRKLSVFQSVAGRQTYQKIFVLDGAGCIGSRMIRLLLDKGYDVMVADNLTTGHKSVLRGVMHTLADITDAHSLEAVFGSYDFDAVLLTWNPITLHWITSL